MKLTNTQNRAVGELVDHCVKNYLSDKNTSNKIIEFKAPTGSGKTFMLANFIDKMITKNREINNGNQKIIFIIVTLSSADLPRQMENNIKDYLPYLQNRHINIQRQESPSTSDKNIKDKDVRFFAENEKVLIFGSSSFGKKRLFTEYGIFDAFLQQIENQDYKLIYIRDEAHHGGLINNKDTKDYEEKFESKVQKAANFVVKMTATPKGGYEQVIITEDQLRKDNIVLLKNNLMFNHGISRINFEEVSTEEILEVACKEFRNIKDNFYSDSKKEPGLVNINPAMLIQVTDKVSKNKEKFEKDLNIITNILEKNNLQYVKYFSGEKIDSKARNVKSLKEISKNNSDVDVIIFKVGPATGWNIPRACMLLQIRDVSSDTLNKQTIGRIKRNPNPNFYFDENSIANNYYIYSNKKEDTRETMIYKLKNVYETATFASGKINPLLLKQASNTQKYYDDVLSIMNKTEVLQLAKNYLDHLAKYHYLIAKETEIKEGKIVKKLIEEKIWNNIDLEIFCENSILENHKLFSIQLKNKLNNWFESEIMNFDNKISIHLFWYIIIKNYLNDIRGCHKKSVELLKKTSDQKEYILNFQKTLPIYLYNYKNKHDIMIVENIMKYAYVNTLKEKKHVHYFDSETELNFINHITSCLNDYPNYFEKVELWTRNAVFHGINFQYYEEFNDIKNSYPDFIIRYKNNHESHDLIIEVKDFENDYDENKTKNIITAFNNYIDEYKSNWITKDLSIIVAYVSESVDHKILFRGSSTSEKLNKILNHENKKPIWSVKDLFETISE
ncbi:DEAD/DEAH box helicase family protein [Mycoplasma sp. ES3225-GEN-MYC]|uniref:DEAD/DEAH box helicase family protein n=1 Tax=Mycoplasma miroungigenitalium TaxID=754515 RepID=UPI001C0F48FD|nr:DEAD/DEAH box helicase family protein [Mycoplasma miroungigenitalium]MBU4691411.1 DEAD/DEAH box helicase family protein [Mycoplasma miroungigenitalium]